MYIRFFFNRKRTIDLTAGTRWLLISLHSDRKMRDCATSGSVPLYLLRVWGTVRFFVAISYPGHLSDSHNLLLLYLQCVGDSSHALVNFILFCVFDKEIRIKYGKACMRWVCARKADAGESLEVQLTVSVRYQSIEPLSNLMQSKNT